MEYYCVMVKTGAEQAFKERATSALREICPEVQFFFFTHTLRSNRGECFERPVFPGYVFFGVSCLTVPFFSELRRLKDFYRILRDNTDPVKITGESLKELEIFIRSGEHWGISRVRIAPDMKVQAVSGPFVGLEGLVYKINRKRKTITIVSSLTPDGKRIDLLYEDVEVKEPPPLQRRS